MYISEVLDTSLEERYAFFSDFLFDLYINALTFDYVACSFTSIKSSWGLQKLLLLLNSVQSTLKFAAQNYNQCLLFKIRMFLFFECFRMFSNVFMFFEYLHNFLNCQTNFCEFCVIVLVFVIVLVILIVYCSFLLIFLEIFLIFQKKCLTIVLQSFCG